MIELTFKLTEEQVSRLYDATRQSLIEWTERLRDDAGGKFPEGVTAFREDMAVHGRYGKPCPRCGSPVQRIVRLHGGTVWVHAELDKGAVFHFTLPGLEPARSHEQRN